MPRCGDVKYKSFKTKWCLHSLRYTRWKFIPKFNMFWLPGYANCPVWIEFRWLKRQWTIKPVHYFEFDYSKYNMRVVSQIVKDKLERQGYRESDPDYYRLYGILKSLLKEVGHD